MKKTYKLIAGVVLATSSLFAQQSQIMPCFTDQATKQYFAAHPEEKVRYDKEMQEATFAPEYLDQLAKNSRNNGNNSVNSTLSPYVVDTIPVVFHILHQGGVENVPNSYIYQALAEVNRVHCKKTPDSANIVPYFSPVYGANNYVFQLATKDPNGNCTNGIERYYDANTYWDQTAVTPAYTWDRTKYLNVYIVKYICSGTPCPPTSASSYIVGYTYLPGTVSGAFDAVVYRYDFLVGNGSGSTPNARSMAHEFGHWLGLSHTFGNTNNPTTCMSNSDDYLSTATPTVACVGVTDDTPKYQGAFSTCPASTPNSCDASNYANVQNIMDYSSCPLNFTSGQIRRMHNIMGSTVASRNNVMTAANKYATGIRNPLTCVPVPYFHASTRIVCSGTPVTFSDSTDNTRVTAWQWNFQGGTFATGSTASDSMPKVIYNTPGVYAVSYTASTSAGSASITQSSCITVVSSTAKYNTGFAESFETATVPGADWTSANTAGVDWTVTSATGATGSHCVMINNISNVAGDTTTLTGPSFNLGAIGSPVVAFKVSYQQQATTNNDKLQVYASTDCGATWVSKWSRSGTALQPTSVSGTSTSAFTPASGQFATYTVGISSIASNTNVLFKWVFYAGSSVGNNIYLDDIDIVNSLAGIQTIENKVNLSIYPNPSSSTVNISFNLAEKHNIAINVTDMLGRSIETIPSQLYSSGDANVTIGNKASYTPGVYFVSINIDGEQISKKVIIE